MKIQDLQIGARLGIGFFVVMLVATISSSIGLWCLSEVAATTKAMMQEPLTKERMTEEWYRITVSGLKRTLAIAKSSDASLAEFFDAVRPAKGIPRRDCNGTQFSSFPH